MSDMTKEDMKVLLCEALDERNTIGGDQHHIDHEFITMLKKREERRIIRVEKFKLSFIGGIALALVSGLIWLGTTLLNVGHHQP